MTRDPRPDPRAGDVLRHRTNTQLTMTKRGPTGLRGTSVGPGRADGPFIASLPQWTGWTSDAGVLALGPDEALGVAMLPINPTAPRWKVHPLDEHCDLCADLEVPFHDLVMCPHAACHWAFQVCDPCGGLRRARQIVGAHLGECDAALGSPLRYDSERHELIAPSAQLALFGSAR